MASITSKFATIAFLLATLMVTIPRTESVLPADEDPLAFAPTIDYDGFSYNAPPTEAPIEAVVAFAPEDADFKGFRNSSDVIDFLRQCEVNAGMDLDCGLEFHASIFGRHVVKPANDCCHIIVKEGRVCHDLLVKFILRFEGVQYDRNTIFKRSEAVWKHCSRV
ncbi:hypothetical protein QQ045_005835 [Rhodiola kirilowii]